MLSASSQFDLAVIGGGLAGCSAAITASRSGAEVILLEAGNFPRDKVCGEFISAEALDLLADLLPNASAVRALLEAAPVIDCTRLWLQTRMIEVPVSPPALSISRYELDQTLWQAAKAAGVDCRANCEVSAVEGGGPFRLATPGGPLTARVTIVAAGRWSQFTSDRALRPGPKWIGVKAHFRELSPSRTTDLYFFEGGYCGVQPVPGDVVNACAMVRSDRATSLGQVFRLHPKLGGRAASWTPATEAVSTAPLLYRRPQPVRKNIAFVGDAAGFIDPFVGNGISIALRSGRAAAQALSESFLGNRALEECIEMYAAEYARHFAPLLAAASRVRTLLSWPAPAQTAALQLLRLPGVMPFVIRKTRQAA